MINKGDEDIVSMNLKTTRRRRIALNTEAAKRDINSSEIVRQALVLWADTYGAKDLKAAFQSDKYNY